MVPLEIEYKGGDLVGGLFLHRWNGMRIGVERDADVGVSEPFGDHLGMDSRPESESRMGVAQIMKADDW